jgi:hypothetical protein
MVRLARTIYLTLRDDAPAIALMIAEAKSLALSLATDPNTAFELTSSTVNGQTFSGTRSMSNKDRLAMLRLVLRQVESGCPLDITTRAVF